MWKKIINNSKLENYQKINLVVDSDVNVNSINMIPVKVNTDITIKFYVKESLRKIGDNCYFIMPGIYTIVQGKGHILVVNLNCNEIKFQKGQLLTRAYTLNDDDCLNVRMLENRI